MPTLWWRKAETMNDNGWNEYQRLVLSEIRDLKKGQEDLYERFGQVQVDIATLKVKSTFWGALGGLAVVVGAVLVQVAFK